MFGKNTPAKARSAADGFLLHSIFYTIQGEGPFAGMPAIFVRFAGCNLRCTWCDTEFEKGARKISAEKLMDEIALLISQHECQLVVLTGGEPMLQPLTGLIALLDSHAIAVQIETAGTVWPEGLTEWLKEAFCPEVTFVVSPKTPDLHPEVIAHADYFKYIIRAGELSEDDGLPFYRTQAVKPANLEVKLFRPESLTDGFNPSSIFVQPCDEPGHTGIPLNSLNMVAATKSALKYGYRLSIQLHKIAGLE